MPREDEPTISRLYEETLTKDQLHDLIHSRKKPGHWEDGVVSYFRVYKIIEMLREENKPCTPHLVTAIDVLSDGKSKIRNQSTYDFCRYVKFQVEHHVERTDEELQQQVERLMPGCLPIGPECESLGITGDILFNDEKSFKEPIPLDRITNRVIYELSQFLPRVLENQQSMAKWLQKILHLQNDHIPSVDLITKWCSVLHKETSRKRRSSMSQAQQYLEEKFSFTEFDLENLQKRSSEKTDADEPILQDEQDQPMQSSVEGESSPVTKTVDDPMEADFSGNENGSAENVPGIIAEALDILDEGETQKEQDVNEEKLSDPATADKDSDAQVSSITRQDEDDSATVTRDDSTPVQNEEEQNAASKDKSGAEHPFSKSPQSAATLDESQTSGQHVSQIKSDSKKIAKKDVPKASLKRNRKPTRGGNGKRSSNHGRDDSDSDDASDKDEVTSMTGRKSVNGAQDKAILHKNLAKANKIIKTVLRVVSRLKKEMHVTMNYLETEASKLCDDLKHEQARLEKAKALIDDSSGSVGDETEEEDAGDSEEENRRKSRSKHKSSKNTKMITVQVKPGVKDTLKKPLVRLTPLACQNDGDDSDISDFHDSESSSDSDMKSKMSRAERKVIAHTKLVKGSSSRKGSSVSSVQSRSRPKVTRKCDVSESSRSSQTSSTARRQKPTELKCESGESPANHVNDFDKAKLFSSRVCVSLTRLSQKQMEKAERRNDEMVEVEESEDESLNCKSSRQKAVQKSKAKRFEKTPETESETEPSEEEDDIQWTPEKSAKSTHTDSSEEDYSKGTTARKPLRRNRIASGRSKPQRKNAGEKESRKAATSKGSRSRTSRNADLSDEDAKSSEEDYSDEQKKMRSGSSTCEGALKSAKQSAKTLQSQRRDNREQQHKQSCSEPSSSKEKTKKRSLDDFVKVLNSPKRIKMSTEKKMPKMTARGRRCKDIKIAEESPTNEDDSDCEDNDNDDFLEKAIEQELKRLKEEEIGQRNDEMQKDAGSEGTMVNGGQNAAVNSAGDLKTSEPESSNVSKMDAEVDVCPPLIENQVDKKGNDSVQEVASSDTCSETKVSKGKEGMMGSAQVVKATSSESGFDPHMEFEVDESLLLNETQEERRNKVEVASMSDSDTGTKVNGEQENMNVRVVETKCSEPGLDPQMDIEIDTSPLSSGKQFEEDKTDAERKDPESSCDSQIEMEIDDSLISSEKQDVVVCTYKDKRKGKLCEGNSHKINGQIKEREDAIETGVLEGGGNNCDFRGLEEDSGAIESKGERQENAGSSLDKATDHSDSEEPSVQNSQNISSHRKAENGALQRKRKRKNERGKSNKVSKPVFPGDSIVGKQVRHRSSLGHPDIFKWYKGKVLRKSTASELLKLGEEHFHHLNNLFTIFAVKYEEYTDVSHEALEVAWRKGDLKIVS